MASKIDQYTNERTVPLADDYMDISITNDAGATYPESMKIKWSTLVAIGGIGSLYNTDSSLTANRIATQAGFWLQFRGGVIGVGTTAAPAAKFHIKGDDNLAGTQSLLVQNLAATYNIVQVDNGGQTTLERDTDGNILTLKKSGVDYLTVEARATGGSKTVIGKNNNQSELEGNAKVAAFYSLQYDGTRTNPVFGWDSTTAGSKYYAAFGVVPELRKSLLTDAAVDDINTPLYGNYMRMSGTDTFNDSGTGHTVYGGYILSTGSYTNTGSGNADKIGLRIQMSGASGRNDALLIPAGGGLVGIGTETPDDSTLMDFVSTTQGVGLPAMTTVQRDAIVSPRAGLMIYNATTGKANLYTTSWEEITSA